jgi:protein SCO1/2
VVLVVAPDGRIARYFPGIDYPPRDLRLGLVDASAGRIGTTVDRLLLFCYHYDPATGRYTPAIESALRVGGVLTVVALGGLIAVLRRREGTA